MSSKASSKPKSKIQNPKSKLQNPKSKIQNPKSKLQNPKSKIQTAPFGAATKRTNTKLIQNPKSKLQNPKSKIQNPKSKIQDPKSKIQNPKSKIQNPKSKIQTPNSKIQTPKSKIQTARLEFGFWILDFGLGRAGNGGDGYVANDDVWPCWPPEFGLVGGALACSRKVAGSIPPARGPNWAPISGGGVLPEIEPRFPAPRRGDRGPISGETAGQAGADITLCVSARDVNITRHRPCVHMQETSVSHSIMDFCCVWNIYAASEFFQQNIFLDKTISNIIDYNLNLKKSYLAGFADLKLNAYIYPELQWTQIFVLTDKFRKLIPFMFWPSTSLATHPFADFGVPSISVHFPLIHNP